MARILITNNGTHSAEKWAMTSAEMIFPLDDSHLVGEGLIAAQKFQTSLAELLSGHHKAVIDEEQSSLHANAEHFATPRDGSHFLDHALSDIVEAAAGTPWEKHFAHLEVQEAVRGVLQNHVDTMQHVERLWHAAHNKSEHGDAYTAAFNG